MEQYREVENHRGELMKVQLRPAWFVSGPYGAENRYIGTCNICPGHVAEGQWSAEHRHLAEQMAEAHYQEVHYPVSG